jgi:uncharacterized protein (TIGR02145 family)
MKKNLLLMMMCCPMVLAAQNGVTVSGLAISAGTVTFNVSWQTPMPVTLWSDTVWVFVDYNNKGVMERLPLSPGATLTATSPDGKVIEEPDNNKGVWVAGNARTEGSFSATVKLLTAIKDVGGTCVYASNYPPVGEYSSDAPILSFTGTPMYEILLAKSGGGSTSVKSGDTFLLPCDYTVTSFSDATGAPGIITGEIPGIHQPQGSCTYTEPAVVGTFASFDKNYSASTYVSLIDERDNKVYPVLKMGERWIMARNLNYQKGLYHNTESGQANGKAYTDYSNGVPAIGSYWCPGTGTSSSSYSCEVYGALYTWETAMMLDGIGTWTDITNKYTSTASAGTYNHSRTTHSGNVTGGRGICPENWHVPTDFEWGVFFDAVEGSGTGTVHQTAASSDWYGADAGKKSKAACTGTAADDAPLWTDNGNRGTDSYGFRGLPAGTRNYKGTNFENRSVFAPFWSSSASSNSLAWYREFNYGYATVQRFANYRSRGHSVRCIRD